MTALARTAVLIALLAPACSPPPPPPQQPPVSLALGLHRVTLRVPDGWARLDHGREQRFQRGMARISLSDFGPVTPDGYRREIHRARLLFQQRQLEDARFHLDGVHLRPAFASHQRWEEIREPWETIRDGGLKRALEPGEVQDAYATILSRLASRQAPSLEEIVDRALPDLGHGAQRAVAERREISIGGRPGYRLETWDKLSHAHPASYLLVLNDDNLLVARTELGRFDELQPAFDALVDSLEIEPPEGDCP